MPVPQHPDIAVGLVDGALYLCSPVDPLLLLLPHLIQVWWVVRTQQIALTAVQQQVPAACGPVASIPQSMTCSSARS
jgi:hypothetical protein